MKYADQELFDTCFMLCRGLGIPVYDALPGESASYPFVVIGAVQLDDTSTKTQFFGTANIAIDVWGGHEQRLEVSNISSQTYNILKNIRQLPNYNIIYQSSGSDKQVMRDDSSGSTLWRASMIYNFRFI